MTPGFITIETLDPSKPGARINALLPMELLHKYWKTKPVKVYNLKALRVVLDSPQRIYHGLRRFNQGGWCYAARPEQYFIRPDIEVPLPPKFVFAVYLNPHYHIFEWRLDLADDVDPYAPKDWGHRFGEKVWPPNS